MRNERVPPQSPVPAGPPPVELPVSRAFVLGGWLLARASSRCSKPPLQVRRGAMEQVEVEARRRGPHRAAQPRRSVAELRYRDGRHAGRDLRRSGLRHLPHPGGLWLRPAQPGLYMTDGQGQRIVLGRQLLRRLLHDRVPGSARKSSRGLRRNHDWNDPHGNGRPRGLPDAAATAGREYARTDGPHTSRRIGNAARVPPAGVETDRRVGELSMQTAGAS
jgi:hypothetical protein